MIAMTTLVITPLVQMRNERHLVCLYGRDVDALISVSTQGKHLEEVSQVGVLSI